MTRSQNPLASAFKLDEIASTKLTPQDRDDAHLPRRKLLDLVDALLKHRLTLVHGGPGYGKTGLLMQWRKSLHNQGIVVAWLRLEEEEASASVCLKHMIAACRKSGYMPLDTLPRTGQHDELMPLKSLTTAFINILAEKDERLVLFLDDYNHAQSDETDALFRMLLRNLPRHVHIVIASRWRPDIGIENLRARDDLLEITTEQLRFSKAEVADLLKASGMELDEAELHRLTDRTEGWPIALQMARHWLNGDKTRAHLVSGFSGRTSDLARYLSEQVLVTLPDDQQMFLLVTSILDQVNGDIANALTGRRDGWRMLEQFQERNLFLVAVNDDHQWFRYHTLFLDFLRDRLQRSFADLVPDLHRSAARYLGAQNQIRPAVAHALAAADMDLAARLLSAAGGWRLVMDGRIGIIRSGIKSLPDSVVRKYPLLTLAKVMLLVKDGEIDAGRTYFLAITDHEKWNAEERLDYQLIDHFLTDYTDQTLTLGDIEHIQSLRREVSKYDHLVQALLSDSLAAKYYEFSMLPQALESCADAISHYRVLGSLYGEIFLRFTQSKAYLALGRLNDAEGILLQTRKELDLRFGDGVDLGAQTQIYHAELLCERNMLDEAAACLYPAIPVIEQSDGWFELYAAAYISAAAVARRNDGLEAALAVLDRAREIAVTRRLDRLTLIADCDAVYYLFLDGQKSKATQFRDNLESAFATREAPPSYRFMSLIATRLSMIHILDGAIDKADSLLAPYIRMAERQSEVRQLISLRLLAADCAQSAGDMVRAARLLDRAIHDGLFTGIKRPYVDHACRLMPTISHILQDTQTRLQPDRYRDNFLRDLKREFERNSKRQGHQGITLTPAEIDLLRELDHGYSNKEIAVHLGISPNTIKYRLKNLFAKLDVSLRGDAVRISRERGLIGQLDSH